MRTIELNAPVIKLLAAGKSDEASKLYASLHVSASDTDLGTNDPAKVALIQNLNKTMDNLTAQEQSGAKTLHFKAESGNVAVHALLRPHVGQATLKPVLIAATMPATLPR